MYLVLVQYMRSVWIQAKANTKQLGKWQLEATLYCTCTSKHKINRIYNKILDSRLVLRASICHVIGERSCGCPITAVQFQLYVIGCLKLDTYAIRMSDTCTVMGSSLLVPYCFQNVWNIPLTFSIKRRGSQRLLNREICY